VTVYDDDQRISNVVHDSATHVVIQIAPVPPDNLPFQVRAAPTLQIAMPSKLTPARQLRVDNKS
jgi:hypothetical protein